MLWLALGIIAAVAVIGGGSAVCWYLQLKEDERQHTMGANHYDATKAKRGAA